MIVNFFIFAILIFFSAFFSASETALFSLSNLRLRALKERYPQAKTVEKLLKNPTRLLSTVVFGNMLVNISFSSLAAAIFVSRYGEKGLILAVIFSGISILFLGEVFPKILAIHSKEKLSLVLAPPVNVFSRVFFFLIFAIEQTANFFSNFFLKPRKQKLSYSEEELKTALGLSKDGGQITASEEEMISYVLEFKDTQASEILTARVEIEGIDTESSQDEVLKILRTKHHSKFPIYQDSLDNIVGILYAKDIFLQPHLDYRAVLREAIFVPESKKIDDLLKLFLKRGERIAIVLDEYGGTQGLVTREDIEEEIFGEIYDEFESPEEVIEKIDDRTWRIYGKTPIKTVNLELDLNLPEEEDTLAGFLLSKMEKIPHVGEKISFHNMEFSIERATVKRIVSVILKK